MISQTIQYVADPPAEGCAGLLPLDSLTADLYRSCSDAAQLFDALNEPLGACGHLMQTAQRVGASVNCFFESGPQPGLSPVLFIRPDAADAPACAPFGAYPETAKGHPVASCAPHAHSWSEVAPEPWTPPTTTANAPKGTASVESTCHLAQVHAPALFELPHSCEQPPSSSVAPEFPFSAPGQGLARLFAPPGPATAPASTAASVSTAAWTAAATRPAQELWPNRDPEPEHIWTGVPTDGNLAVTLNPLVELNASISPAAQPTTAPQSGAPGHCGATAAGGFRPTAPQPLYADAAAFEHDGLPTSPGEGVFEHYGLPSASAEDLAPPALFEGLKRGSNGPNKGAEGDDADSAKGNKGKNDPVGGSVASIGQAGASSASGTGQAAGVNMVIGSLIGEFTINTTNLYEDLSRVKELVIEALVSAVNDVNYG